jgi:serine/threonine protein kinase
MLGNPHDASGRGVDAAGAACGSVQTKGDTPGTISIKVAPAPPPSGDEYPEIKAAVQAAQKEVKAGAKLKFDQLYRLGQVVGTGHYARVQLAISLKDGKKYAVKIMAKSDGKEALLQQLQSEWHAPASVCRQLVCCCLVWPAVWLLLV